MLLQSQLDAMHKDAAVGQVDAVKHAVAVEANLKSVCAALEAKESDLKKAKYDSISQTKQMQKVGGPGEGWVGQQQV